jgi:hypothetical protein
VTVSFSRRTLLHRIRQLVRTDCSCFRLSPAEGPCVESQTLQNVPAATYRWSVVTRPENESCLTSRDGFRVLFAFSDDYCCITSLPSAPFNGVIEQMVKKMMRSLWVGHSAPQKLGGDHGRKADTSRALHTSSSVILIVI